LKKGLVLKSTGSWYTVKSEDNSIYNCTIKGKVRTFNLKSTNPVAVGDYVEFEIQDGQTGVIVDILDRKNYIIRKSSNLSKQSHILAANVDETFLVITLAFPETSLEFIDRFLAAAEAYSIPVTLVINKIDLYKESLSDLIKEIHAIYEPIGYPVIEISVLQQTNMDVLSSKFAGKTSLLSGNSGVGKSSIINYFYPELQLRTNEISNYHFKGKHTTTFAEMIELPQGGYIIDTPGIKGFGMVNMERNEIYHFFPEIFKHAANCQYNNCLHIDEPKCAVKEAVKNNLISESRYVSYLHIMNDDNEKYR
jgi:ribosome biogenesis GTPase / thiamine phosphate phosphatase